MHELAITEGILNIALDAAGGRRITAIDLLIGDLSSILDDSVQFYFDILSRGTAAESARLRFHRRAGSVRCTVCGHEFPAHIPLLPACPACGGAHLQITGGREMRVESIEVEENGDPSR